jgi:NADPH:quinone reductase-like Zn-dependent oxidoreductase
VAVKAIVAREPGPPEVLELREVDTPSPGPNEILIKVAAAGVNRADLLQRQGHYQPLRASVPSWSRGFRNDRCRGCGRYQLGNRGHCVALLAGGGYAEYAVAPAGQVVPPPLG